MGINDDETVFLTQEEHELFQLSQTELDCEELDDHKHGFENAIMEVHREYNLRSKKKLYATSKQNNENPNKKTSNTT